MGEWTYGMIGVFGLILASVGLAGVTAYAVDSAAGRLGYGSRLAPRRPRCCGWS